MILRLSSSFIVCLSVVLTFEANARADAVPPDICYALNEPCTWESSSGEIHGICRTSTCSRAKPDGTVTYECLLCVYDPSATSADTSAQTSDDSAPAEDASDAPSDDAGKEGGRSSDSDCDCVVLGYRRGGWLGAAMLLLGFTALQRVRRNSRQSSGAFRTQSK